MLRSENIQCSVESFESIAYLDRIRRAKFSKNMNPGQPPETIVTSERITRIVPVRKWTFTEFSTYIQELYKWGYPLHTVLLDLTYFGQLPDRQDYLVTKLSKNSPCLGAIEFLSFTDGYLRFTQSITLNEFVEKIPEISKDALSLAKREKRRKKN